MSNIAATRWILPKLLLLKLTLFSCGHSVRARGGTGRQLHTQHRGGRAADLGVLPKWIRRIEGGRVHGDDAVCAVAAARGRHQPSLACARVQVRNLRDSRHAKTRCKRGDSRAQVHAQCKSNGESVLCSQQPTCFPSSRLRKSSCMRTSRHTCLHARKQLAEALPAAWPC
jgi:hypothetical protein